MLVIVGLVIESFVKGVLFFMIMVWFIGMFRRDFVLLCIMCRVFVVLNVFRRGVYVSVVLMSVVFRIFLYVM